MSRVLRGTDRGAQCRDWEHCYEASPGELMRDMADFRWEWSKSPTVAYTQDLILRGVLNVDKFTRKWSKEYSVWMDYAVLIMGQRGIYVHEGPDNLNDNGGPSAGCIHLGTENAKDFFDWVSGPTRIQISYPW